MLSTRDTEFLLSRAQGYHAVRTVDFQNSYAANAITTGGLVNVKLSPVALPPVINEFNIELTITESGTAAVELAPIHNWIDNIEIKYNGTTVQRIYGEELYYQLMNVESDSSKPLLYHMGINSAYRELNRTCTTSGTLKYLIPLYTSVMTKLQTFDWRKLKSDIVFYIKFRSTCVASGSGVPTLTGIKAIIKTESLPPVALSKLSDVAMARKDGVFLECEELLSDQSTYTASTQKTIATLEALNGKYAFAVVGFRASGNPVSNASNAGMSYVSLGPAATYDLLTPSNASLLGQGTAVQQYILRDLIASQVPNAEFVNNRNLFIIPFCRNVYQTWTKGIADGFIEFKSGEKNSLVCVPDAAAVASTQTITLSGTAASGSFMLSYAGQNTDAMAYNADETTALAAKLSALPIAKDRGLTFACDAKVSAGTSVVVSITSTNLNNNVDRYNDLVSLIPIGLATSGSAIVSASTALTTHAKPGFKSSQSLGAVIYFYKFKRLACQNGNIAAVNV